MMVIAQNCEAAEAEIDLMPRSFSSARVHSALLDIKMIWETASWQTRHSAQLSAQHLNPLQAVNHVWNSQMCPRPEETNWKEPVNNQTFFFPPDLFVKQKVFEDNLLMTLKQQTYETTLSKADSNVILRHTALLCSEMTKITDNCLLQVQTPSHMQRGAAVVWKLCSLLLKFKSKPLRSNIPATTQINSFFFLPRSPCKSCRFLSSRLPGLNTCVYF